MKMINKKTALKRNGGFSIMEAVIALAVIVIVTVSALSIATSSLVAKTKLINRSQAQSFAQDVWECFKVSDDKDEFDANLIFAIDAIDAINTIDAIDAIDKTLVYDSKSNSYRYNSKRFDAKIKIDNSFSELTVTVLDKNGKEIISLNYDKYVESGVSG